MSTSEDAKIFEVISSHFVAPVFFYLSFVMGCFTVLVVWNAFANPHNLPLGGVAFLLSYNSFMAGKKLVLSGSLCKWHKKGLQRRSSGVA